ncbi:natural resistance-associated macrophage protein [Suhomyces tanzawaensis NRRL Y-17324]|uniref:Natural resistance-associated macrophage protein n=1 Tax=Suhomyces tanzawaensis NRRL Y-17324 TaxID=984487 RepID=A0A1E4SJG8_9ASCO|nr:natural resistance-associated macrophage protein [Suhomyces tanzawaensis NRRL Y-17324]ODV79638.1 natural resistance-associated macrophage protein [Suhomyces tanzawaensis NRRL Y-17324]
MFSAILSNRYALRVSKVLKKYAAFIGPGLVVSVSYMDPGNYLTSVSSGALYQYKLCFLIFMSNIFAVILQSLCVKLGTITGLDLAEMCRLHLPYQLNLTLYACAELAIIATDLAEVVGTAIALEILFGIPLAYGVLITILDVLIILFAYHKDGSLKQTKVFEFLVSILVFCTCICFVLELFKCDFPPGSFLAIIEGFLPINKEIFKELNALFLSCGIVGSTVMPHSLFLGSALVQPRLKDYDVKIGNIQEPVEDEATEEEVDQDNNLTATLHKFQSISDGSNLRTKYRPSYQAIKYCLNYSYIELILSLFIVAVFVNSAILIVAGSTLFGKPDAEEADLLSIYEMLSYYISPAAGLVFALSMLFSGQSAGIVCTMAGQIISEGFINWTIKPWIRRIVTRTLAIIPVLIVIMVLGREGVSKIMNSSQVVLSFILPIVSAPLIWFTSRKEYMTVYDTTTNTNEESSLLLHSELSEDGTQEVRVRKFTFENGVFLRNASIATWLLITFLNFYLIYAFANGADI